MLELGLDVKMKLILWMDFFKQVHLSRRGLCVKVEYTSIRRASKYSTVMDFQPRSDRGYARHCKRDSLTLVVT